MQELKDLPSSLKAVEIWKERNRICVVFQFHPLQNVPTIEPYPYCTGYVSTLKKNYGKSCIEFEEKIISEELTFAGNLCLFSDEIWFLGFDSAHAFDSEKTRSPEAVRKRTKRLAHEMIEKKI
jgi:hypothetical protein